MTRDNQNSSNTLFLSQGTNALTSTKQGLLHYWDLGGTTDITDKHGNLDLTNSSCTTSSGGAPDSGDCVAMTATQYLDRASFVTELVSTWSIQVWFLLDSITSLTNQLMSHRSGAGDRHWQVLYDNEATDLMRVATSSDGTNFDSDASHAEDKALATWFHVVGTCDGTTINQYLDGNATPVATDTFAGLGSSDAAFAIGTSAASKGTATVGHAGRVFAFGIWGRALTTAEVSTLYNSGSGLRYAAL